MFMSMTVPSVKTVYMYKDPIPMNWGEKKFMELARNKMGIEPTPGKVFLFYNKKKDQLKIFFLNTDGSQIFHRILPDNTFILPAPEPGKPYVTIERKNLGKVFKTDLF